MSHVDDYNRGKIDAAELNRRVEADMRKLEARRKNRKWVVLGCAVGFLALVWAFNHMSASADKSVECYNKYPVTDGMPQAEKEARWYLQDLCKEGKD